MKQYGPSKATEFTRKQIGVIFSKAKQGELKVEKFIMADMYELADYYGYDYNRSVERAEQRIKAILDKVFAGDIEAAQEEINQYTEYVWRSLSIKGQKEASREFVS